MGDNEKKSMQGLIQASGAKCLWANCVVSPS